MPLTISGDTPNFSAATITTGTITTATITTGTVTTLNAPSGVLATQNGMTGIAKAWVQFGGTTPTINGSFNVGSITKNGTGDYTVNFTTAMPNANYVVSGGANTNLAANGWGTISPFVGNTSPYYQTPTTSSFRMVISYNGGVSGSIDPVLGGVAVFSS